MSVEINFYLTDSDFSKLRLLKEMEGYDWETYNDFAEKLLCRTMTRMYHEYIRPANRMDIPDPQNIPHIKAR